MRAERPVAGLLALVLAVGPAFPARAQAAYFRSRPAPPSVSAPVSAPVLSVLSPSLPAADIVLPILPLALEMTPLNVPTAPPAAAAPMVSEAVASVAAAAQPWTTAAQKIQGLGREATPVLKGLSAPNGGAESAYADGRYLEDLLSGLRPRAEAALPVAGRAYSGAASLALRHGDDFHEDIVPDAAAPPAATAPPAASAAGPATPAPKGFGSFVFGISAVKVGVEAMNLSLPILLLAHTGSAALIGGLYVAADLAGLLASLLGGAWVDRLRPSRVLAATAFLQAAAVAAIPLVVLSGMPYATVVAAALFVSAGALGELFGVARRATLPILVGQDEETLRSYNGRAYIWRESTGIAAVLLAGLVADRLGYMASLWMHPVSYLVAAYAFWRISRRRIEGALGPLAVPRLRSVAELKDDFIRGWRLVIGNPVLRRVFLVNAPVVTLHKVFHALGAVVYATKMLGNPAYAALLLGAWNAGELAVALALRHKHAAGAALPSWLRYGALMSLSGWLLWLWPSLTMAIVVSFLMATATLGNELALMAAMQAAVPKKNLGAALGFVYATATGVSMVSLAVLGFLFDWLAPAYLGATLAILLTVAGVFYLVSSRRK